MCMFHFHFRKEDTVRLGKENYFPFTTITTTEEETYHFQRNLSSFTNNKVLWSSKQHIHATNLYRWALEKEYGECVARFIAQCSQLDEWNAMVENFIHFILSEPAIESSLSRKSIINIYLIFMGVSWSEICVCLREQRHIKSRRKFQRKVIISCAPLSYRCSDKLRTRSVGFRRCN